MQSVLWILIALLATVLLVVWQRLYCQRRSQRLDFDAISLTPTGGVDLTGHWRAWQELETGYFLWGVTLNQYGRTVTGWMQCKFAAAHALSIRGIVMDGRLIATWWRPHKHLIGSGIIDLVVQPDANSMIGTIKWYNAGDENEHVVKWRWERSVPVNSSEK